MCAFLLLVIKQMRKYCQSPKWPKSIAKLCTYRCDLQIKNCKCKFSKFFFYIPSRNRAVWLFIVLFTPSILCCEIV